MTTTSGTRAGIDQFVTVVTALVGLTFAIQGVWAFFWPESFYENVGDFAPYNLHYTHDVGAFQVGIGAMLLLALFTSDALLATLAGGFVGSAMHAISHVMDHDHGGRSSGPWLLSVFALLLLVALILRYLSRRHCAVAEEDQTMRRTQA